MRIHEFGREHEKTILLIHPAAARWDYFSGVIPLLALLIPALPGYNEAAPKEDYTSVEEIAESLADWLLGQGLNEVDVGYGCAMGGSILLAMLAKGRVHILTSVLDGGITPGTLPQPLGRLLAAGDALSGRTIWRTGISCRTYQLEGTLSEKPIHLQYWFGEAEERERTRDLWQLAQRHRTKASAAG